MDTWTLKKADEKRLVAFEMRCYRRLLRIRWQDFQTNESIRIQFSRQHTIMDRVRRRKLELFGHICRMPDNRTLKRVLFGAVEGRNYQGRPRKRWVDDILKWCDMTLQQASHHAQDRATWRNLIAGPYGSWTTGQEEEEELYTSAVCEETLCIRSYYTEWSPVLNSHMWYF